MARAHPVDETTGKAFLDLPPTQPGAQIRPLLTEAIGLLIQGQVGQQPEPRQQLQQLANHPMVTAFERK